MSDITCAWEGEPCDLPVESGQWGASKYCAKHRKAKQRKKLGKASQSARGQRYATPFERVLETGRVYHLTDTGNEKEYFRNFQRYIQALRDWHKAKTAKDERKKARQKDCPTPG